MPILTINSDRQVRCRVLDTPFFTHRFYSEGERLLLVVNVGNDAPRDCVRCLGIEDRYLLIEQAQRLS